jgi:hypothetical protein
MYIEGNDRMDCFERDSVWKERCIQWITSHPGGYMKQIPSKVFYTYISDNVNLCALMKDKSKPYMYGEISMASLKQDFPRYSPIQLLTLINLLYYYALMITFIIGAICMVRRRDKQVSLSLLIIVLGTMAIAMVAHGEARFHNPYMPFVMLIVACYINRKFPASLTGTDR